MLRSEQTLIYDITLNQPQVTELLTLNQGLPSWLVYGFCLFFAGLLGMIYNYKNFLITMMCAELMYLGAATSFITHGVVCQDSRGAVYGLVLLILAACESAVGLGITIVLYRFGRSIDFQDFEELGG